MAALAVTGARLFPMTGGGVIENATVAMEGGRFAEIGADLSPPKGARVLEAAGAIATPGLIVLGSRIGVSGAPGDEAALEEPIDAADILDANGPLLAIARADGITRALSIADGKGPVLGLAAVARLAEGPRILERSAAAVVARIAVPREAPSESRRAAAFRALRAALEAKAGGGAPVAVWAAREADIRLAVALAHEHGRRLIILGGAEAWRAAELLAEAKAAVALHPFEGLPASWDEVGARTDNAAQLDAAGVAIGFCAWTVPAGHNPGTAIREAAGSAVANGLSWERGLAALTCGPAAILGLDDRCGAVAEGLDADLVLWDGDPLEPASRPTAVIVAGEPVSLVTRQDRLAERHHPRHAGAAWPAAYR